MQASARDLASSYGMTARNADDLGLPEICPRFQRYLDRPLRVSTVWNFRRRFDVGKRKGGNRPHRKYECPRSCGGPSSRLIVLTAPCTFSMHQYFGSFSW